MKKIIWSPIGKQSLKETTSFISALWNQHIVDEFLDKLDYRIEQIQHNPKLASSYNSSEFRQLLVHKSVSIFYRDNPEYIKILLVWDNRQDPKKLFEKLTNSNIR